LNEWEEMNKKISYYIMRYKGLEYHYF
jgi:hypothetical protein